MTAARCPIQLSSHCSRADKHSQRQALASGNSIPSRSTSGQSGVRDVRGAAAALDRGGGFGAGGSGVLFSAVLMSGMHNGMCKISQRVGPMMGTPACQYLGAGGMPPRGVDAEEPGGSCDPGDPDELLAQAGAAKEQLPLDMQVRW